MMLTTQFLTYFGAIAGVFLVGFWFARREAEASAIADANKLRDLRMPFEPTPPGEVEERHVFVKGVGVVPVASGPSKPETERARFRQILRLLENLLQRDEEEERQRARTGQEPPPTVRSR